MPWGKCLQPCDQPPAVFGNSLPRHPQVLKSYESCGRIALTWINYVRYRTFISRHARLADGKRLFRRASLIISGIYSRSAEQKFLWSVLELTSIGAVAAEDRIEMFDTNAGAPQRTIAALALVFRLKQ